MLLVVGTVTAMPHSSHDDHDDDHDDHDDIEELIMVQCLAENGEKGENLVPCLQCFEEVDDIEEKKGLDKARACVAKFLPQTQQACSTLLSGLTAGDDDQGEEVLDCFHNTVLNMEAKKCLDVSGTSSGVVDSFTEAALCLVEAMHNATTFVKAIKLMEDAGHNHHGHGHGRRGNQLHHQLKQSMKMVPAHCHQAIGHQQNKLMVCEECFHNAVHSDQTQVWSRLADCNTNHLSPAYDACTDIINGIHIDQLNHLSVIKDCYMRTLTRSLVEDCSTGQEVSSSLEDFIAVFECGHEKVEEYIEQDDH